MRIWQLVVHSTQRWHTCMQRVAAPYASQTLICVVRAQQAAVASRSGKTQPQTSLRNYLQTPAAAAAAKHGCQ
jgi:type IV secretory pathway VirB2 component (pilin)